MRYKHHLIAITLLLISNFSFANDKVISVATLSDYAPFCMASEDSKSNQFIPVGQDAVGFSGYSWDVFRASFHRMGYSIQISVTPWARALHSLQSGKVDILFPAGKSVERLKVFDYSKEPISEINFALYVNADSTIQWQGLASLEGLTVGVKRAFNYGDRWNSTTDIIKFDVNGSQQGFKMLASNRIDALLGYEYSWDYFLKQAGWKHKYRKLAILDSTHEYLASLKSNPRRKTLFKAFEQGKKQLIESGELGKLKQKWFGNNQ
ncbi:ABC-type amino acid transport/signal transduction system protein, periplasmic component/domain [Shewanella sediminis HAW-EB3]|uniref:ABC-type amino acid transport/signal transduction system protein, periplasmic component/domain n=1 Tax=Shewanella sediminis (strain HAW-EB3) TaxID=425104 RepID=A8FYH4_SHESH|nr:transporter substrate-binding domain-containing protein [Shewanella sediminis]ABV37897.1 ABC-type amino acid transport/signal transduction system protein, periplasmic component/domain [Shewanella sediminis HAW-EB3]